MSKRRSWVRALVILSVLALVAACGDGDDEAAETTAAPTTAAPTTAAPEPEEPIKLGTIWFNSGVAVGLGDIMRNGFELAVNQKNASGGLLGRQIEVIHYDEGYSADESVASARKAIADGVAGVAGGNDATTCVAMKDAAAEVGMPLVVTACGSELVTEEGYEGVVHIRAPVKQSQSDSNALSVLARWMIQQGYQRVQGVGVDSDWVRLTHDEFTRIFAEEAPDDFEYTGMVYFPYGTAEARVEVTKGVGNEPDLLYLGLWGKDVVVNAVQAAREIGYEGDIMVNEVVYTPPEVEALGDLSEGIYSSTGWILDESIPEAAAFSEAYESAFGHAPDWWSELGYTAAQQLIAAIEAAGSTDHAAVAPLMNDEHGFTTPRGKPLRFNEKGLRLVDDWIIIQSRDGVLLPVDAVPLAG
ncbi:MAG: ABC transporter substrate-binding protein [bacterium]|nr:ABC transporter substrate-binding protein [Acidimicrobiia bacterium]MCY4649001.1 ABC transporter substrate-binding protein [bacterium]